MGSTDLRVQRQGDGPPLVFLHGDTGLLFAGPFLEALSSRYEVIAPVLPGWAGSERPRHLGTVDDLSYVVLDLLESLPTGPVHLVGASIGAWVAAEVATKSQARINGLVLCSPIGIKTGGREERAFVDLYATPTDELRALLYGDVGRAPDLRELDTEGLLELTQAEEAVARYAWEPYLHSRTLRQRLYRVHVPTLVVGGDADRFVLEPSYLQGWTEAIGVNAAERVVAGAGHRIEEEIPGDLAAIVHEFLDATLESTTVREPAALASHGER